MAIDGSGGACTHHTIDKQVSGTDTDFSIDSRQAQHALHCFYRHPRASSRLGACVDPSNPGVGPLARKLLTKNRQPNFLAITRVPFCALLRRIRVNEDMIVFGVVYTYNALASSPNTWRSKNSLNQKMPKAGARGAKVPATKFNGCARRSGADQRGTCALPVRGRDARSLLLSSGADVIR
jgi:hypothetical protein